MKLLLIKDEKRMLQALTEILRRENYSVDTCIDGISGLQARLRALSRRSIRVHCSDGKMTFTVSVPTVK